MDFFTQMTLVNNSTGSATLAAIVGCVAIAVGIYWIVQRSKNSQPQQMAEEPKQTKKSGRMACDDVDDQDCGILSVPL
jgi:hypothetical protein